MALNLSVELVNLATGDKETSDNNTKQCTDLFLITDEHVLFSAYIYKIYGQGLIL